MGTSHRHTPTVVGEPNWGNASASVTSIATAEEELDKLDNELEGEENADDTSDNYENDGEKNESRTAVSPERIAKRQRQLDSQIRRNYHHAVRNLVRAAGGRGKVSSGGSRAIGHAGVVIAGGLVSAISEIVKNGLSDWLSRRGIHSLEGKSCQDVLDLIREYIEDGIAGMDNTAANEALECVMDDLGEKIGDDFAAFDAAMVGILASEDIKDLLDKFFGMYIFSHLSQDFKEKLEYEKGTKVMNETMDEIKDLILDDIQRSRGERDTVSIDWGTEEGTVFIQQEFDRIIYILSGNED
jgi:hypothetical protein